MPELPFKQGDVVILVKPKDPYDLNRLAVVLDCFYDDSDAMVNFTWKNNNEVNGCLYADRFRHYSAIRRP